MLRNKILKASGGGVLPTEVIDFGDTYTTTNTSSSPSLTVSANYQAGDVLVLFTYLYDSTISLIEYTNVNNQTVNGISPTSSYGATQRSNTLVFGYYYTADSSGSSLSINLENNTAPAQYIYCAIYVLRAASTDHFARARQTWTTGTSDTSISYEDGVSAIVGFAAYREDATVTATPFTVTSTVGTVDAEAAQVIDSGNAGAVAFNLPYTQTTGSSSLTITSDDNASGTTWKSILSFAF
jgi:hypothetical protein